MPLLLAFLALWSSEALATPPNYRSFHRVQRIDIDMPEQDVLRIWALYIGQGDALLIQLPSRFSYTLDGRQERIEVLVDGGPGLALRAALKALFPTPTTIEHVVLTHHDSDHVAGLIKLLADEGFGIGRIYHNGLASWKPSVKDFPSRGQPSCPHAILESDKGMACFQDDGTMQPDYLIDTLDQLKTAFDADQLVGQYGDFANAIDNKSMPSRVTAFEHVHRGSSFINEAEGDRLGDAIRFEVIWPRDPARRYREWSYSINGNSVTFKLTYGAFSMLFTGDLNEDSEADLLSLLASPQEIAVLGSDVLKVPHHGSKHNEESFFAAVKPVVSVASMGSRGFRADWGHPATKVIRWLGGPHRVYLTYVHERHFRWDHLGDDHSREALIETKHVVIETDGEWFRVVEVEIPTANLPSVRATKRGDGTRWISAREIE